MLKLEKITSYMVASELSDEIWRAVSSWSILVKKTIGEQLIRSTDSIAANIAEGEGRYFKKDKIKFFLQARGSTFESIHWIEKVFVRKLLTLDDYEKMKTKLEILPKEINFLIKNINQNLKK